jgi:hypothetical protein
MMDEMPLSARVFIGVGAALLAIGAVLFALGSFASVAIFSLGIFFLAQAMIARVIRDPFRRLGAALLVTGGFLYLYASVMSPLQVPALAILVGGALVLVYSLARAR